MKERRSKSMDSLYIASAIAWKDILDLLKNRATRVNVLIILALIGFFYFYSTSRPFDKRIDVVVYAEKPSSLTFQTVQLSDGNELKFYPLASLSAMKDSMRDRELGLVIPAGFDYSSQGDDMPVLQGYIHWAQRNKASELETQYTSMLSEGLGVPVQLSIDDNFVIPDYDKLMSSTPQYILLATLMMAILVVPHLLIEERQTKTIEALLVSPVTSGQVVLGKALAGFFYVALSGILSFMINWAYITNWGLAILAFFCTAFFGIGTALLMGSFLKSWGQINLWSFVIMTLLILPALFGTDPTVSAGLKYIFSLWPTTALAYMLQFSFSSGVPGAALLRELSIALGFTILIYALIVWHVRRTEAMSSTG